MTAPKNQAETTTENPVTAPAEETKHQSKEGSSPTIGYFTIPEIAQSVREDIKRTDYPKYNPVIVAAKAAQAVGQIAAASALPIDANNSKADGLLEKDLQAAREAQEMKSNKAGEAEALAHQTEQQVAEIKPPLSLNKRIGIVGLIAFLTIAGVLSLKWLLASSFNEILLRGYYDSLGISGAEIYSDEVAHTLVMYLAITLLGGKAVGVLASWGQISQKLKVGMILVAVCFSLCFALARLALDFNLTALMLSGVEFAVLLSYTLALLAIAHVLKTDADRADQYRTAQTKLSVERRHAEALRQEAQTAKDAYHQQRQIVAEREDAARRATLNQDLARKVVEAESLIAYAELISEHAERVRGRRSERPESDKSETALRKDEHPDTLSPKIAGGAR